MFIFNNNVYTRTKLVLYFQSSYFFPATSLSLSTVLHKMKSFDLKMKKFVKLNLLKNVF